ncbi:LCP family protein [Candidatus Allofournierella merdavium]|uniref:LCP family protein n=1 Tax=Candidatus Allofournierella merdavium TaxID=2838593 RepID=UPI00374EBA27
MSKPTKKASALKLALAVLAVLLLAACGTMWYLYSQVAPALDEGEAGQLNQVKDPDLEAEGDRTYNLLLLGIDYDTDRDYAEGKGNTDVILYLQIDRDAGTVNAFQIPRDTYYGEDMGEGRKAIEGKINEVYANGPDQENLINNIANMMYELFKLPVDDYVTIDMAAFKTMLNNMGGIEMYVPWDIVTVDKNTGKEDVVAKQGTHLISGDTAELILRNRNYATADYQRLETQQYFYAALVKSLLEDYTLADYYSTCKVIAHYINTSLDITDIWGLYGTMLKVKPENIYIVRAPGGAAHINGHKWVYYIDRENCARILNEHFRSPDKPVAAEDLGLATGYEYISGMNVDEGRTMGSVMSAAEEGQQELNASSSASSGSSASAAD